MTMQVDFICNLSWLTGPGPTVSIPEVIRLEYAAGGNLHCRMYNRRYEFDNLSSDRDDRFALLFFERGVGSRTSLRCELRTADG